VQAGLGVAAQSGLLLSLPHGDLAPVGPEADLPPLGEVEFVVLGRSARLHGATAALAALVEAEGPDLWPPPHIEPAQTAAMPGELRVG
jgi:hypothetical protein